MKPAFFLLQLSIILMDRNNHWGLIWAIFFFSPQNYILYVFCYPVVIFSFRSDNKLLKTGLRTTALEWLERRTHDRKVPGSSSGRSGGKIFFSRVNFLCWLLFRYLFHPRVTAVACKRSRSFLQKCRWQVTPKHIYTLPIWFWMKWHCKLVHGWMVYTELALKWQYFTWHQPCNIHRALPVHHFVDINNTRYKRIQSLIQNRMPMCTVSLLKSRE